jgi:hypothetical protein
VNGLRTHVVETEHLRLEVALDAGPRIVRLSLPGGRNVFAETPELDWPTVHGRPYRLLGGHRLWSSPECPLDEQVPDDEPIVVRELAGGIAVEGATRTHDGLTRRIELRPAADGPRVRVTHVLENHGDRPVRAAAWALTQVAPGGVAVLPLPRDGGSAQLPNRNVVLWPYSSVADPRFELTDGELRVRATADAGFFKVGCLNVSGEVFYELEDVTFRKRFEPDPGAEHVDFGCNTEVYVRAEFLELETLSPLRDVAPGSSIVHVEEWELERR